ncbi:L-serine ammonia-lyase, iron-sulfur-dependent, subunit alpha [Coriobacteriales bacterium OH1046]|nr:L-serine ammonia-lyase, iron-sulfur-dependent, subunit alpha [Coriobacteriales bacterium OH1046]
MQTSAFEILGPIMVGPSSSHTAGALRIALVARSLAPSPLEQVEFTLYNSFAHTYRGHGTDRALVAGMLGFMPDDVRVRESFEHARREGLDWGFIEGPDDAGLHPNTVTISMRARTGRQVSVTGESLGGGRVRISSIDGVGVEITGDSPTLFVAHRDIPGVLAGLTGKLSEAGSNIATVRTFRRERGGQAYTIFELDAPIEKELADDLRGASNVSAVSIVQIPGAGHTAIGSDAAHDFLSGADLLEACRREGSSIGAVMRLRERELDPGTDVDAAMRRVLEAMRAETRDPIERPVRSLGGLLGGQARAVSQAGASLATPLMGETLTKAVSYAMATLERSATMGVIVAAPTAGSAGIVPGAVLAVGEALGVDDGHITDALWCACAVGAIIARNASVSGAEGGCQAEVGSAAAMAAAAVVELLGGSPEVALSAASTAIANLLGLVCDPVRGLVEHPCQDRNALGVANAIVSAQLALSGVLDPLPFDEVVAALKSVGEALPASLRETALGGLAAAPSAQTACSHCIGCMPRP